MEEVVLRVPGVGARGPVDAVFRVPVAARPGDGDGSVVGLVSMGVLVMKAQEKERIAHPRRPCSESTLQNLPTTSSFNS